MSTSGEILRRAISEVGVKAVARSMGSSQSNVYRWFEDRDGSRPPANPLSRCVRLLEITGDKEIVGFLCQKADGFFCNNPDTKQNEPQSAEEQSQRVFLTRCEHDAVQAVLTLMTRGDCGDLREQWEDIKRAGEEFVRAEEAKENSTCDDYRHPDR